MVLWVGNKEVVTGVDNLGPFEKWNDTLVLNFDMWMLARSVQMEATFGLQLENVEFHIAENLSTDSSRKLKGNPLVWRLNKATDYLSGEKRLH